MEEIKKVILDLLDIVTYLHKNGFMHRDINPENILINSTTKQIKLIDFGVAVPAIEKENNLSFIG